VYVLAYYYILFGHGCSDNSGGFSFGTNNRDQVVDNETDLTCTSQDGDVSNFSVEDTDVATVFTVSWIASGENHFLRYEVKDEEEDWIPANSEGDQHSVQIILPTLSEVNLQPAVQIASSIQCAQGQTVQTSALYSELPELSLQGERQQGFIAAPVFSETFRFSTVIDGSGNYIWAMEIPYGNSPSLMTQSHITHNGQVISHFIWGDSVDEIEEDPNIDKLFEYNLDGSIRNIFEVPGWHHSFTEVEPGTYAGVGSDFYQYESGRTIFGDTIVELSADGTLTEIWNSFDSFSPEDPMFINEDDNDWTHVNFVHYDAQRDKYMIVLDRINAVAQIDRSSGTLDWYVSGNTEQATDIQVVDENPLSVLNYPHSIYWLEDDRYLVFNRSYPELLDEMPCSEITEVRIDTENRTLKKIASIPSAECSLVLFLGNAQPLPDKNVLAVWSDKGQMDVLNTDYQSIWKLNSNLGSAFGYGMWSANLGHR
jgi:hypothetical protein